MSYLAGNAVYILESFKIDHAEDDDYKRVCGAGILIEDNNFSNNIGLKKTNGGAVVIRCDIGFETQSPSGSVKIREQTIYDEKDLIQKFICMSSKFLIHDESKPNELSFQQANTIYDHTRQYLREIEDPDSEQGYFINPGRQATFD